MNIIRNTAIWILSLAAVFILYSSMASADDRFTKLEADWNAKDTLAVQENFSRTDDAVSSQLQFLADAELGQTLVIREVKRLEGVAYSAWGVNATLDGKPVKWRSVWRGCFGFGCLCHNQP